MVEATATDSQPAQEGFNSPSTSKATNSTPNSLPPPPSYLTTDQADSLLSTLFATTPSSSSSGNNANNNVNRLTGRQVTIPMGKQAFRLGHLKPTLDENQNELVEIRAPDIDNIQCEENKNRPSSFKMVQVSTKTAKEWLLQSSSIKKPEQAKPVPATTTASNKLKSSLKSKPNTFSSPTVASPAIGGGDFINIVEEYDSTGKQIDGSVYDVSRQLQQIWQNADEDAPRTGGEEKQNLYDGVLSGQEQQQHEEPKPVTISDQEYESLTSRLDELVRLEEEASKSTLSTPKEELASKKKTKKKQGTTSTGWSKGFLNAGFNKKKAGGKKKTPPTNPVSKTDTTYIETQSQSPREESHTVAKPRTGGGGVVIDTDRNSVQEIPRIGTQKVPPKVRQNPQPSSSSSMESTSMFSGVVQERPKQQTSIGGGEVIGERPKRVSRFAQERQQPQHGVAPVSTATSTATESTTGKTKSRFAQEREQQRTYRQRQQQSR